MSYYIAKTVSGAFDSVVEDVTARLKAQGFGILTDIDVQATLKSKIGADMPKYRILGACKPRFAHEALKLEDKLGVLLPCNVIVRETSDKRVEVAGYRSRVLHGTNWQCRSTINCRGGAAPAVKCGLGRRDIRVRARGTDTSTCLFGVHSNSSVPIDRCSDGYVQVARLHGIGMRTWINNRRQDMKNSFYIAAIAAIAFLIQPTFAQQAVAPPAQSAPPQQSTPTPAEVDRQFAKMQELMTKMSEQMTKLQQTHDPQQRQQLLQEHWTTMQTAMGTMHGMWGGGMMGCCGGGHMMGGPMMGGGHMMMWSDYRNLTPEQLRERQYMMDRWMPMQQMMMDQMMQHQNWMMQPPPPSK
jgi:uncharacterized protein (DUF302 family)